MTHVRLSRPVDIRLSGMFSSYPIRLSSIDISAAKHPHYQRMNAIEPQYMGCMSHPISTQS
jgi:hypothetical protein